MNKEAKANPMEQDQPHWQLLLEPVLFFFFYIVKILSLSTPSLTPFFTFFFSFGDQSGFKSTFFGLQPL